jgi:hypothetical protein
MSLPPLGPIKWKTWFNPTLNRTFKVGTARVIRADQGIITLAELKPGDLAEIRDVTPGNEAWKGLVVGMSKDFGLIWMHDRTRSGATSTQVKTLQLVTQWDQVVLTTDTKLSDRAVDELLNPRP